MNYLQIGSKVITTPLYDIIMDIRSQLKNGKLKQVKRQGDRNIRITCPHHKNGLEESADCDVHIGSPIKDKDGNIIVDYGTVKCFACGFHGPFYHFVAECFDESDEWAKAWLIENYYDGLVEIKEDLEPITLINQDSSCDVMDESFLNKLEDFHPYMLERKLTKEVIKEFEIKYNPETKCLVFPVRDDKGRLVMTTQRSVEGKKYIIQEGKRKPVYLLYYLKKRNIPEAFICESQINALTLWTHGLPGVALFGTGADYQYKLLNKSGIRVFNLMFDGDSAGDKGIAKFLENIRKDVIVNIIHLPRGKDVNDLEYNELEALIQKELA